MKVLFVTTISNTVNAFLIPHIKVLVEAGHKVDIACKIEEEISPELFEIGCDITDIPFNRNPLNKKNISAHIQLKKLLNNKSYDLVHTHTPVASVIARLVCRKYTDTKLYYTAHGFHFYKGGPWINWLFYYPLEKILSKYTDTLITINKTDYDLAKEKFKMKKIYIIPGVGFSRERLKVNDSRTELRNSLNLDNKDFVVISIGELNKNKNHQAIINAIHNIDDKKIKYLIVGQGILHNKIKRLIAMHGLQEQVFLLGQRSDVANLLNASDLFAFPSRREGLGMAAIEAMYLGLPLVASNIHGINDYLVNGINGFSSSPNDINTFSNSIERLMLDKQLRTFISNNNKIKSEEYSMEASISSMIEIYKEDIEFKEK